MERNSINSNKLGKIIKESDNKLSNKRLELRQETNGTVPYTVLNGTQKSRKVDRSIQVTLSQGDDKRKFQSVTICQLVLDKANMCTFTGTVLATMALANVWKGRYFLGLTMSILASLADILDGPIARSSRARRPPVCTVGKYLDTYSDVISHFVVPASLLMDMSDLNPVCVLLAAAFVCTGVLRHARHEIIERLDGDSCAYGVTSDYLVSTFVIVMHLALVVQKQTLVVILSSVMVISIFVSLSKVLRSRRYSGMNLIVTGIFHIWLAFSCIFLRHILVSNKDSFWTSDENDYNSESRFYGFTIGQLAIGFFCIHLTLAYPCYYRFVERNV